jgi:hypothetical protein
VHDWRDLQRIKNQLVGPECEAVELYPAESRKVDTANQCGVCSTRPSGSMGLRPAPRHQRAQRRVNAAAVCGGAGINHVMTQA